MNTQQPTDGRNSSDNPGCPHCYIQLPPGAVFCSSCGERVKKIGDEEIRTEDGEDNVQEQEVDTVRIALISHKHLKRWQSSQPLKNTMSVEQPHINSPLPQDAEAPMSSLLETEIPRAEFADTRTQHVASIPIKLSQSLPTTPAPSIPETWQQIPETEVPPAKPPESNRSWPIIIILSAVATGLVYFVFTDIAVRPVVMFWFLVVCPGMVLVRFLRLKEPVVEWTLAIALSFAIDALVAGIQLYAGKWSPTGTLSILLGLSLGGAIVQLSTIGFISIFIVKPLQIVRSRKLRVIFAILLAWVERFWNVLWSLRLRRPTSSVPSTTSRRLDVYKPESSEAQPPTVAVPRQQSHALHSRKSGTLWPFAWKQRVQKPTAASAIKRRGGSRAWKPGIILIFLALLIGLSVVAGFLSHASIHSAIPRSSVTAPESKSTFTPTSVSTVYPLIAGTYNGTIYNVSSNVSKSLSLFEVRQSQGKISGYLILGSRLQGSDPFSGTIDTAKHLQFIVTDATGHAIFFFRGAMQSATSLSGDYYQCSPNFTQNSLCSRASGAYGIWNVVLVS